jgi:hypothetical protein
VNGMDRRLIEAAIDWLAEAAEGQRVCR